MDNAKQQGEGRTLGPSNWCETITTGDAGTNLVSTFEFYGVVCTWMEADIIAATVQNAFAQGCTRVFIVDNDSPDDTCRVATDAGAEVGCIYQSKGFDEARRLSAVNDLIARVSMGSGADSVWWLVSDADELCHGRSGQTLRESLARTDGRCRTVGAYALHHVPDQDLASVPGIHPIEFQPLCAEIERPWCVAGHWKHPLLRWDRNAPFCKAAPGFHTVAAGETLREPLSDIILHHFPYRDRSDTERRLQALNARDRLGHSRVSGVAPWPIRSGMERRWETLRAVYEGRWSEVAILAGNLDTGIVPVDWRTLVPLSDQEFPRWYACDPIVRRASA